VLGEKLFDRELDQRELAVAGDDVVLVGAQNEKGDRVDRGVRFEPHPQRAHVVRGASGDVEHADALAGDIEREVAAVVVGDDVVARRVELHQHEARAGTVEGDRQLDAGAAALDVRHPRSQQRRRRPIEELTDGDRQRATAQPTRARHLDDELQGLVGDRRAGGADGSDRRVAELFASDRNGVNRNRRRAVRGLRQLGGGRRSLEGPIRNDDDCPRQLSVGVQRFAERGAEIGSIGVRRACAQRRRAPFAETKEAKSDVFSAVSQRRDGHLGVGPAALVVVRREQQTARFVDQHRDFRSDAAAAAGDDHRSQQREQTQRRREQPGQRHQPRALAALLAPTLPHELDDEQPEAEHREGDRGKDQRLRQIARKTEGLVHGRAAAPARRRMRCGAWTWSSLYVLQSRYIARLTASRTARSRC
jgi:hypothetical protein